MKNKIAVNIFCGLVCLALTASIWVSKELLFPFVTTKAFFFRAVIGVALPFYVYILLVRPEARPNFRNPLTVAIVVFWLVNLLSAFAGVGVTKSLWGNFERMGGVFYLLNLVLLYFYIVALAAVGGGYVKKVLDVSIVVACIICLNGILTKFGVLNIIADPSLPRLSSTLGNPIYVGSFLIVPLFFCIFLGLSELGWKRHLYYLAALMQLWTIFLSGTRGAVMGILIGLAISIPLYLVFTKSKKIKMYGWTLAISVTVVFSLLFTFHNKLPAGSMMYRIFNLKDSNTYSRLIQWQMALKGYPERPLLGVGPENYYYISNKHYNPELYKYDSSWFDKPHNYILEILVTNGLAGAIAYGAALLASLWIIYLSYREQWVSLEQGIVLVCCLLAYQFQNLFVFDTIPAALMFYVLLGFFSYLWHTSNVPKLSRTSGTLPQGFIPAVTVLSIVLAAYTLYAGTYMPVRAARATNYGFAYGTGLADIQKAENYFEEAESNRFNFDLPETASKHAMVTATVLQAVPKRADPELEDQILEQNIAVMQEVVGDVNSNPIFWQQLANLYIFQSVRKQSLMPYAEAAAHRAIELAPSRVEVYYPLVQIKMLQRDYVQALEILRSMSKLNEGDSALSWQQSSVYQQAGQISEAAQLAEQAMDKGYVLRSVSEFNWLAEYYEGQKEYTKLESLYNREIVLLPNELNGYLKLAAVQIKLGKKDTARNMLVQLMDASIKDKSEIEKLLNTIQ